MDLHKIGIKTDDEQTNNFQQDHSIIDKQCSVQVFFKNLENHLIKHIEENDIVIGCVAWLTSKPILRALAKKDAVALVIQKEDFLRPDIDSDNKWNNQLHKLYSSLPSVLTRNDTSLKNTILYQMSFAGDPSIESIRCVGNHNSEKSIVFPRSHHKFLIFCKYKNKKPEWQPYKVWTGSYNLTKNANMSFENAVVLKNKKIVRAYFKEWAQIEAISEKLDWSSKWCTPEWRIGS